MENRGVKVCHFTSVHEANDVRIFEKMCSSLAKAGYDVYLVAPGSDRYEKNGVKVIGVGEKPVSRIRRMWRWAKKVYEKAVQVDADLYHFHDPELLPYGLKLKKKGKIVVFDSHEDSAAQIAEKAWIPRFMRKPLGFFFMKYQARICRRLDAVVSVTPHICERFEKLGCYTEMIANYPVIRQNERHIYNGNGRKIVFAGSVWAQWCHHTILDAISDMDVTYVILGGGNPSYINDLKGKQGWTQADYRGKVPHEEVEKVLGECNAGMAVLAPSNNTGGRLGTLGNTKIFEYMAAGIPVICTGFILWKQIIDEYNCGICVDFESSRQISQAIRQLLDNPGTARKMGENGRRAVEEKYNWKKEETKLFELYTHILN